MKYVILGRTGLKVSRIGFGAIKLPEISVEEATQILNKALDLGINFIDTARRYGDSETKIGIALKNRRDDFYIASKTPERDADGALKDLKISLKELQTDYIDIYQLHSVSSVDAWNKVMAINGALRGLKRARSEGLIEHIGITIHRDLNVMRWAIESNEFETIMLAYNPLDPEGVEREGILRMAHEYGIGVIIMKPLSGGQLTSAAGDEGTDVLARDSLRFVLSNPYVNTVIPGMRRLKEVEENVAALEASIPMSEEEKKELILRIGQLRRHFRYGQICLRCGYCLPCTVGITIPEVFRAYDMYVGYPNEVKGLALEIYARLEVKPTACIKCLTCIPKCPAGINIPERLEQAAKILDEALNKKQ